MTESDKPKQDHYPNMSGFWLTEEKEESPFFIWLEPSTTGPKTRVILDALGIGYMSNGFFLPSQVRFKKKYTLTKGGTQYVLLYTATEKQQDGSLFGQWKTPYAKRVSMKGYFAIEPYKQGAAMDASVRQLSRDITTRFNHELGLHLTYAPANTLPQDKMPTLQHIIALGKPPRLF